MLDERGQTTQDYLVGVSLMLLTVLFVFGYVPSVFGSTGADLGGVERSQADRAATYLVETYSVEGREQTLRYGEPDGIHNELSTEEGFERFRNRSGLNTRTNTLAPPNVNVMLVNSSELNATSPTPIVDGGERYSYPDGGAPNLGQAVVTETRVVRLAGDTEHCTPTCWLIVRIW
ncbi:DUF7287 family protein [Halorientalis regularis]|uniref:Uncharacterized protein n=1 Tax=Halorientalis regularis TaxID=660518 RepID=A0A1G7F3E5_9EURY|nr:hypothetical protein [Halorientalis regularis]SDE70473.1 hypothetical protein SAMN05216218_10110 [Halorientalis regularis]